MSLTKLNLPVFPKNPNDFIRAEDDPISGELGIRPIHKSIEDSINDTVDQVIDNITDIELLSTDNTNNKVRLDSLENLGESHTNQLTTFSLEMESLESDNNLNKDNILSMQTITSSHTSELATHEYRILSMEDQIDSKLDSIENPVEGNLVEQAITGQLIDSGISKTLINTLNSDNTSNKSRITTLEGDNTNNRGRITSLETLTNSHTTQINTKMDLVSSPILNHMVSMDTNGNSKGSGILSSSITTQGNAFNGNNQLVQTNNTGVIPNSLLTPATNTTSGTSKLYTSLGTNIDGSVTQAIIKSSVDNLQSQITTNSSSISNKMSLVSSPIVDRLISTTNSGDSKDSGIAVNTVTTQGNSFNGVSQLIQTNSSGQLPTLSGINLTNLNGSNISSGTLPDSRLSTNVTLLGNTFNSNNQLVQLNNTGIFPSLNGSNLTNLTGTNISSGTITDARLSTNVTLLGNTFNGNLQLVQLNGTGLLPTLNGSNLTNLNASNLSLGTINSLRLPQANSSTIGGVKLYTGTGVNTDGGVDQNTYTSFVNSLKGYETRFSKTGMTWGLSNNSTTNLVNGLGTSQTGTLTTNNYVNPTGNLATCTLLSGTAPTGITTYNFSGYLNYVIQVRIMGTIGGSILTTPTFTVQLNRTSDNIVISSKTLFVPASGAFVIAESFQTLTNTSSDPFITGGFYISLINNSGSTYTISSLLIGARGSL